MRMKGKIDDERKMHKKIKLGTTMFIIGASLAITATFSTNNVHDILQQVLHAHAAETTPQPSGSVIARGEDGVPWELYENGYLLFKPIVGKDTLTNDHGDVTWKREHGQKIKYVGFEGKVYAPSNSQVLFSKNAGYFPKQKNYNFMPIFIDTSKLDVSKVTDARSMFAESSKLLTLNVSNWDTSNIQNMNAMFQLTSQLTTLDVSNWNTSKVNDMSLMFSSYNVRDLDVSKWNVSNVTTMQSMFSYASRIAYLDVSKWDVSNVTNMKSMFKRYRGFRELAFQNWNTQNVTDMSGMFENSAFKSLTSIKNWNTSNVTNMSKMFFGTDKLTRLNLHNWDVQRVNDFSRIFAISKVLETLDIRDWQVRSDTDIANMFGGSTKLRELTIGQGITAHAIESVVGEGHAYGNQYTDRWYKLNDEDHSYTVNDWATTYAANPTASAGTWVRERVKDTTITFCGQGTPPTVIKNGSPMITKFPDPTNIKPGHKFKGWSRTTDGDVITPDSIQPGENITLYPKWEPVNNTSTTTEKIVITTEYRSDNSLDYGKRNETPGREGEKQVTTTYTVTPITGELTNPVKTEVITTPMKPKIVTIGTKPTDQVTEIPSPKRYVKDPDRRKGDPDIIEKGTPGSITTTTTYTVNPNDGTVTSNVGTPVRKDPTPTIIKIAAKDDIEVIKKPSPIVYEKDPNRARNTPDEKTEGTPGSITTITSYDVDESDGHTTTRVGTPVTKEPTPTIIRIGAKDHTVNTPIPPKVRYEKDPNRERNTPDEKIVGNPGNSAVTTAYNVNPKDGTVTETQQPPVITPPGTTIIRIGAKDHTDVKVVPSKVIYEKDPTRDRGEPDIKKEGTPGKETTVTTYDVDPNDGTVASHVGTPTKVDSTPTIIKIAARDKVEMIHKNGSDPIRRTTRYDVDPDTGNVTESHKDELPATGTFGTIITSISATTLVAFSVLLKRFKKTR